MGLGVSAEEEWAGTVESSVTSRSSTMPKREGLRRDREPVVLTPKAGPPAVATESVVRSKVSTCISECLVCTCNTFPVFNLQALDLTMIFL